MESEGSPGKGKRKIDSLDLGKIPPQAIEIEQAVLGAIIAEPRNLSAIVDFIKPGVFYKLAHQHIYEAIVRLHENSNPLDELTVINELKSMGLLEDAGGPFYIAQLTNRVASAVNTEYHARILYQMFLKREVIRLCGEFVHMAYDDTTDPFELIQNARLELEALDSSFTSDQKATASSAVDEAIRSIHIRMSGSVKTFYETGWSKFDQLIGISFNEILLIGGPAGHGKTKFVIATMLRLLLRHNDVAIDWYTFEDPMDKIIRNMFAAVTGIEDDDQKSKKKKLTEEEFNGIVSVKAAISTWDIEFHETPMSIKNVRFGFTKFCQKRKNKLCICIIDNLLLLEEDRRLVGNFRDDFIMKEISKMRQITKGLIIPIHHFNDAQQESLNVKTAYRPLPKHLKGGEAYRRVPTQILLINKPGEYSDILNLYPDRDELIYLFIGDLIKNRDNGTITEDDKGLIRWLCHLGILKFEEL